MKRPRCPAGGEAAVAAPMGPPAGLAVHVVCDPGGGAPTLDVNRIRRQVFAAEPLLSTAQQHQQLGNSETPSSDVQEGPGHVQGVNTVAAADERVAENGCSGSLMDAAGKAETPDRHQGTKRLAEGDAGRSSGGQSDEERGSHADKGMAQVAADDGLHADTDGEAAGEPHDAVVGRMACSSSCMGQPAAHDPPEAAAATMTTGDAAGGGQPLLLLIPLTLGAGKVNPLYLPQLQRVLTFPQSVGIVGGRPGSSLLFVGHQVRGAGSSCS